MAPPPAPSAPPTRQDARRAAARRTTVAGLVCTAVATALVGAAFWPTVAGTAAAALAVGLGVAALVRSAGTGRRTLLVVGAVAVLVLGGTSLLTGAARLALWPVAEAYDRCVSSTLTISGGARCQQQLEEDVWSYLSGEGTAAESSGATGPAGSAPAADRPA